MTLQAEVDHDEQSLIDYSEMRFERAWSRSVVSNAALSAVAGTEFVRARMPAPQREPSGERRIDSPPLHDGEHHDEDEAQQNRRGGFLRPGPLALALALPLILATAAGGYLYWDYAGRFQSTDDAFIGARLFHGS